MKLFEKRSTRYISSSARSSRSRSDDKREARRAKRTNERQAERNALANGGRRLEQFDPVCDRSQYFGWES